MAEVMEAVGGEAVGGRLAPSSLETRIGGVSTDSREDCAGRLFIPIVGRRHDGHDHMAAALASGAPCALCDRGHAAMAESAAPGSGRVILVGDTVKAMGDLAGAYLRKVRAMGGCGPKVVAVTGSAGKTATKGLAKAAMQGGGLRVRATEGNRNNLIGAPQTVFGLAPGDDVLLLEMGMSSAGEIASLSRMARPDVAVITNVGMAHIEGLGSHEGILRAKLEVAWGMAGGVLAVNGDDLRLYGAAAGHGAEYGVPSGVRVESFGLGEASGVRGTDVAVGADGCPAFTVAYRGSVGRARVPAIGAHGVHNGLAALAAALLVGVRLGDAVAGMAAGETGRMRMEPKPSARLGCTVIDDTYNANPESTEASLAAVAAMGCAGRRVAVLGDMLELGPWAEEAHYACGQAAGRLGFDALVAVGAHSGRYGAGAVAGGIAPRRVWEFKDKAEAAEHLKGFLREGDLALVKGSRGSAMEDIVALLA